MDPALIALLSFVILLILIFLGMPIAFAMALCGIGGFWIIGGAQATAYMAGMIPWQKVATYAFSVVPLFVLMGNLVFYCGYGRDAYHSARQWVGHFPAGLAQATVLASAIFGAATGSSVASTATMAKVAVPEMDRYGYDKGLATAAVAASGTMAVMIPPSVTAILYGMVTEASVSKMLIAGILPGIFEGFLYMVQIFVRAKINPSLGKALPPANWKDRFLALKGVGSIAVLFLAVMGTIYTGVATPTEAGAFGAFAALLLGFVTKRLTISNLWKALFESTKVVGTIYIIVVGAFLFNALLAYSNIPRMAAQFISALPVPPIGILIAIQIMYLFLGCIMPNAAMLFLTMPTIFPIAVAMGWDPIWFGILYIHVAETGMITPPLGITLFATSAVLPNVKIEEIIRGIMPFIMCDMLLMVLLIAFPWIALFLPSMMVG